MENKLRSLIYYTFAALFLITPLLMFHKTSEIFEFNKMLFIYLCALIIGSLWIARMIVIQKIYITKTILDIPLMLFFGALILSTFFSIDIHTSIFGYYGRFNGGLLSIATFILLFYAFVTHFNRKSVQKLLTLSVLTSVFSILWSLPGVFGYDLTCLIFTGKFSANCWTAQFNPTVRLFSTLGQPNWFGAYLAVNFMIGLYFFFSSAWKSRDYYLYTLAEILIFSALLLTRSRSAFLALAIGIGLFTVTLRHSGKEQSSASRISSKYLMRLWTSQSDEIKKLFLLCLIMVIPLFIIKTGIPKVDNVLSGKIFFSSQSNQNTNVSEPSGVTDSFDIRKVVWKGGIDLGLKYPLFGSGVETFAYAYFQTRPMQHNITSEWDFLYNKAHNEYINYFATTGVVGLISYILLIGVYVVWIMKKISRPIKADFPNERLFLVGIASSYVTILITNFFGFSTTTLNIFFFLLPAAAICFVDSHEKKEIPFPDFIKIQKNKKLILLFPMIIFISGILYLSAYFLADINYSYAEGFYGIAEYDAAKQYYETAVKFRNEHVYRDKLSQLLATKAFLQENRDYIGEAQKQNEKALNMSSQNPLYFRTRAKNNYLFYQLTRKEDYLNSAISSIHVAQKLAPTDPRFLYMEALFYSNQEKPSNVDLSRAIQLLNSAIGLKPNYRDAYFLKGTTLRKQKKIDEARKAFEFILSNIVPNDEEAKIELENLGKY